MDSAQQDVVQKPLDAPTRICQNCDRTVPADSLHCPHCCGDDGQRGEAKRGAFTGGILGLITGAMGTAVLLAIIGPEYNTWGMVSGIVLGFVIVGAVMGVMNSRNA